MKVLVTGGTGVIGDSVVRALHARGHTVRVLTRHAGRDQRWWPPGVDGWAGDVSDERTIRGAAQDCEAVIHVAGIVTEDPPNRTFQRVNIDGTRYVALEAELSGARTTSRPVSLLNRRTRSFCDVRSAPAISSD